VGPAWQSRKLSIHTNYVYQTAAYLPITGFFAGDRKGTFADANYSPFKRLSLAVSVSRYENNLGDNPNIPSLKDNSISTGLNVLLPGAVNLSGLRRRPRQCLATC